MRHPGKGTGQLQQEPASQANVHNQGSLCPEGSAAKSLSLLNDPQEKGPKESIDGSQGDMHSAEALSSRDSQGGGPCQQQASCMFAGQGDLCPTGHLPVGIATYTEVRPYNHIQPFAKPEDDT